MGFGILSAMKNAYTLLGLATIIVFIGAYLAVEEANAPSAEPVQSTTSSSGPITKSNNNHESMSLTLSSPAFEENGQIPSKYTCDGQGINPELDISNVPGGTESLVLLMDDPDIPDNVKATIGQDAFDHWVLYAIDPSTKTIPEGVGDALGSAGLNSGGRSGYTGPCPPDGEHRYVFTLYALKGTLNFIKAPTLSEVRTAAESNMLEKTELIGHYTRTQ
jgi:hypothetical protein